MPVTQGEKYLKKKKYFLRILRSCKYHTERSTQINVGLFCFHQVSASDVDTGTAGRVTYRIVQGDESGHFRLGSEDGRLSVIQAPDLQRKTDPPQITLIIQASDGEAIFLPLAAFFLQTR